MSAATENMIAEQTATSSQSKSSGNSNRESNSSVIDQNSWNINQLPTDVRKRYNSRNKFQSKSTDLISSRATRKPWWEQQIDLIAAGRSEYGSGESTVKKGEISCEGDTTIGMFHNGGGPTHCLVHVARRRRRTPRSLSARPPTSRRKKGSKSLLKSPFLRQLQKSSPPLVEVDEEEKEEENFAIHDRNVFDSFD